MNKNGIPIVSITLIIFFLIKTFSCSKSTTQPYGRIGFLFLGKHPVATTK